MNCDGMATLSFVLSTSESYEVQFGIQRTYIKYIFCCGIRVIQCVCIRKDDETINSYSS